MTSMLLHHIHQIYEGREEEERGKGRRGVGGATDSIFYELSEVAASTQSDSTLVLSFEYCSNERIKILPITK